MLRQLNFKLEMQGDSGHLPSKETFLAQINQRNNRFIRMACCRKG